MSRSNSDIRSQLGCGPAGRYDMSKQVATIVKNKQKYIPKAFIYLGAWLIFDENRENLRPATHEEIKAAQC